MRAFFSIAVGRAWQKWKEFLLIGHTKAFLFLILSVTVCLVGVVIVNAQSPDVVGRAIGDAVTKIGNITAALTPAGIANGIINGVAYIFLALSRLFLLFTVFLLDFFLKLAAYNAFIDAPPVVVGWYMVRDLANMFFIVALLVIAFSTMLGLENYAWKKSLVRLIMAAILINFSRLILGFFIDISHVVTLTFLNAVEGAAGGNVVNMLHLDKILQISAGTNTPGNENIYLELLAGAAAALIFSIISLFTIGAYSILMLIRVLILWMLIILSPLAFVLSSLPQTQSYAKEFWGEFTKYIIVGPMMTFFLWLSFATLGNGDISNTLQTAGGSETLDSLSSTVFGTASNNPSVSVNAIARWENLSGFFVAVGFLLLGIERVQKIGLRGSDIAGSIINAGKKVTKGALKYGAIAGTGVVPYKYGKSYGKYYASVLAETGKTAYANTLGKGDLIREGKAAEYKARTKATEDRWKAVGSRISPAGDSLARATVDLKNEQNRGNAEQLRSEFKIRNDQMKDEKARLKEAVAKGEQKKGSKFDEKERAEYVKKYFEDPRNANNMPMLSSIYQDALLKAQQGKFEGAAAGQLAVMRDFDRVYRGLDPKEVMLNQDDAQTKAMTDYAKFNFQERTDAIRKNFREIDRLKKAGVADDDSRLETARGNMDALIQSSLRQGEGTNLMNILREENRGFSDITESAENIPQLILGLQGALENKLPSIMAGAKSSAQSTAMKQKAIDDAQQALLKSLGEKGQGSMRNMVSSMEENARQTQGWQWKGQIRRGNDTQENNMPVYGFARAMGNTANAPGTRFVTGTANAKDGNTLQDESVDYNRRDQRISNIEKAPTVFHVDINNHASGFVDAAMKKMVESLGTANESVISGLKKSLMNVLSGGTEMKSGYNGRTFDFSQSSKEIKDTFKKIVLNLESRVVDAKARGNKNEATNRQRALDAMIKSATGDASLKDAEIKRIIDEIRKL